MLEVLLDNRDGNVWNLSKIISEISWKTERIGKPGSLDLTFIKGGIYQDKKFVINPGDVISVKYDNTPVFFGYVFNIETGNGESVKVAAYDQIRYLLNVDTYVFKNITVSEIIRRIAKDFKLKVGKLAETNYKIPKMMEDKQSLLDIIDKAITLTFSNTGRDYVLYDNFGELTLQYVNETLTDFWIGDQSLMYDFSHSRDIDSDTYNVIKLYKDNKKTGKREIYKAQDSANIAKWGMLQLYQSVDEDMNNAQINKLLTQLAQLKNREGRSLKIDAIGDIRVRAGIYLRVLIEELGVNQPFLIDECTHKFSGGAHTMSLNLRVV